ncbi:hypothetical protein NIES2098_45910 [Calothrix sp. NIES-2098]|nr:hypothetical protein NIES2098_45910 [Calothrix sp. NIES-2098]
MRVLPFLSLPKLFNYLYLYNYKAINISLFLSVCEGTSWQGSRVKSQGSLVIGCYLFPPCLPTLPTLPHLPLATGK